MQVLSAAADHVPKVKEVLREHVQLRLEVRRMHDLYSRQHSRAPAGLAEPASLAEATRPSAWIQRETKYK